MITKYYISKLKFICLITAVPVIVLFSLDQTSWAAIFACPPIADKICFGTPQDDIIIGTSDNAQIYGLEGNDYILGSPADHNYIWGGDGNDILIGGGLSDGLYGGNGSDKYDGRFGDDTILEESGPQNYKNSNDIVSGGRGDDYIFTGGGADSINGGPDDDLIYPNPYHRDFSTDSVDCGSGWDSVGVYYSGDGETANYCEFISNNDG